MELGASSRIHTNEGDQEKRNEPKPQIPICGPVCPSDHIARYRTRTTASLTAMGSDHSRVNVRERQEETGGRAAETARPP